MPSLPINSEGIKPYFPMKGSICPSFLAEAAAVYIQDMGMAGEPVQQSAGWKCRLCAGWLYVGLALGMACEKPAGRIAGVREKAVDAGLLYRWIENNFGLPVLVSHLVVVFDGYSAKGLAPGCKTVAKNAEVGGIGDSKQDQRR
jgi:hypothetical protein